MRGRDREYTSGGATGRWTPSVRWSVVVTASLAVVAACTPGERTEEPIEVDGQDTVESGERIVRHDPGDDLDGPAAAAAQEVPDDWEVLTIDDDQTGPFAVGVPAGLPAWAVGAALTRFEETVGDTAWWSFWEPRLTPLEPEISNVRAMVVDPDQDGEPVTLQLNVTPYDLDVPPDDAEGIADVYGTVLEAQGSDVHEVGTVTWDGTEIAEVVHTVPDELVPEARDVRQWFYPVGDRGALWSVQCDAPAGAAVDERCTTVLSSFRPPD